MIPDVEALSLAMRKALWLCKRNGFVFEGYNKCEPYGVEPYSVRIDWRTLRALRRRGLLRVTSDTCPNGKMKWVMK